MKQERLQAIFTAIPTLETPRLLLRRILPKDAKDMFDYSKRESVVRYLLWDVHPDEAYTASYIDYLQQRYEIGDLFDWAVVLKKEGRMIGTCGFTQIDTVNDTAEIGYVINDTYRGSGYAPEAAKEVIRFGFEKLGLMRISALCMRDNSASLSVMAKCGMQREGLLRSAILVKGRREDVHVAAVTRQDYQDQQQ